MKKVKNRRPPVRKKATVAHRKAARLRTEEGSKMLEALDHARYDARTECAADKMSEEDREAFLGFYRLDPEQIINMSEEGRRRHEMLRTKYMPTVSEAEIDARLAAKVAMEPSCT